MSMRAIGARTAQTVLCILVLLVCASAQNPPASNERVRALQQPAINASTATTMVPEVYWQQERSAVARLAESHLQASVSRQSENGIVISQTPAPGTTIKIGSTVSITIGPPQLLLTTSAPTVKINQAVEFTATLEPPFSALVTARELVLPQPRYTFDWGDNTQTGPIDSISISHSYGAARSYNVSAKVQTGNFSLTSNAVTVTVENPVQPPSYRVNLKIDPRKIETGGKVVASATVSPAPPPDTSHTFIWGDGSRDTQPSPTATHTYGAPPRKHPVQAIVRINGTEIRSNPVLVEVTAPSPQPVQELPPPSGWPVWQIVVAVAVGVLIFSGAYKLIRSRKPSSASQPQPVPEPLSVIAKPGPVTHEIRKPENIRSRPAVRIKSGCTIQTNLKPADGIATTKKRSASNA